MRIISVQMPKRNFSNPTKMQKHFFPNASSSKSTLSNLIIGSMMAFLPLGIFTSCGEKTQKDTQGVEYYVDDLTQDMRANYIDSIQHPNHIVCSGENLYSIAKKYNISVSTLKKLNGLQDNIIHQNQVLKIPNSIRIKNVKTIKDVSFATGLSTEYLTNLEQIENPNNTKTIFLDSNNNKTIGVGHKLTKDEIKKYEGRELSESEKYTLLVEDILIRENNIKDIITPIIYDNLPTKLRENVFDYVFHRGETSFKNNKPLVDGLKNCDYKKAVANLYMNYTIVKDINGQDKKRYLAGLCKRSLIRMGDASKIFKNNIPQEVLISAQKTYNEGLILLKEEFAGNKAYDNIKAEYMNVAYEKFNGQLGEKLKIEKEVSQNKSSSQTSTQKTNSQKVLHTSSTPVYVNGQKNFMTKEQIENDWAKTAAKYARPFKRPELCLDAKGNVTAFVKIYAPTTKTGILSGKTIIVNQGHGGCAAHTEAPTNTAFDPGASNAIMQPVLGNNGRFKRNKNGELILKETNNFIGNNNKALEEWKVNENFSKDLIKKLTESGAKVIFISGEVHNAQNTIRKYEKNNKVDLFISLHSNSSELIKTKIGADKKEHISERTAPRGFLIIPNIRGGEDKQDFALAKKINKRFHDDNWLVGLGNVTGRSLGVLSSSKNATSPVPGVLIETGNLKNSKDVANLNSKVFRERLITATYNGIVDYLTNK